MKLKEAFLLNCMDLGKSIEKNENPKQVVDRIINRISAADNDTDTYNIRDSEKMFNLGKIEGIQNMVDSNKEILADGYVVYSL